MKVTLGLIQMGVSPEKGKNVEKAAAMISQAAKKGAQVVCLPELFTSPYFPQDEKADASVYAEMLPGPTTDALSKVASENGVVVVGGSVYEKDRSKFYNSSFVIDADGKFLGRYRKMHIPQDKFYYEQNYFGKGGEFEVFTTKFGKVSPLICYDQWFPEAARSDALLGAEIIFYPTAIGTVKSIEQAEGSWQEAWEAVQRGHAIANSVVVATVNRVGVEGEMTFWGGSFVYDAFGRLLAHGGKGEEVVIAKCDLEHGKFVREGWGFFHNRRPEAYGRLV